MWQIVKTHTHTADCLISLEKPSVAYSITEKLLSRLQSISFQLREDPSRPTITIEGVTIEKSDATSSRLFDQNTVDRMVMHVYNNKAVLLICLGRTDEALDLLLSTFKRFPDSKDACFNLCLLLVRKGRIPEACITWLDFKGISTIGKTFSSDTARYNRKTPTRVIGGHVEARLSLQQDDLFTQYILQQASQRSIHVHTQKLN